MARWLRLLGLRSRYGLAAGRWSVHVFQVRQPDLGDSGPDRAHSVTPDFPSARTRGPAAPPSRRPGLIPAFTARRSSRPT